MDKKHYVSRINYAKKYISPWKHYYITNFLDHNTINKINQDINYIYTDEFKSDLVELIHTKEIRDEFGKLYDFEFDGDVKIDPRAHDANFDYFPHCDIYTKQLSMILYLGTNPPSDGTKIYKAKERESYVKTAPFLNNAMLVFQREAEVTWHSYGPFSQLRHSVCIFYIASDS